MTERTDAATVPARSWFDRDVLLVAQDLLGAYVTTRRPDGDVTLRITEVEAYDGERDPGSHAFRGPSQRNRAMYGEPGHLYVYRHLGLHHCANIVCGPEGRASAVLLRAGEVTGGEAVAFARRRAKGRCDAPRQLARGPARLTVALGVTLADYGVDVVDRLSPIVLQIPAEGASGHLAVASGPRVGVAGDGGDAARFPWRYWLDGEPTVSDYRRATPRRR